jgi:hypothetical protein
VEAAAGLDRQEAVEDEAVGGHARGGERRDHGRGARDRHHGHSRFARRLHQQKAWVGDARRSGVGDQRDGLAVAQGPQQRLALGQLVMLEVGGHRHVDAEVGEERARAPRVLAGDQVHLLEHAQRAQGHVLEVTDGRGDHVQRARRHGSSGMEWANSTTAATTALSRS